jgi:two-component system, OmpR family, KDP operon response regulator KdpE
VTKVLVVDDERQIRRALHLNLTTRGYDVIEAATGEAALTMAASEHPDVVLLDLGLPGIDGLDVIAGLRGWSRVPIVVLTVRDDERSKVAALDAGADDYVTKPFGMAELLARVRAVVRRASDADGAETPLVRTATFDLDLADRRARRLDQPSDVRLTPTEWSIVEHLVRHPGRLVTHRQLIDAVWGPTYDPDPNLLRVHLGHIRRKLETDPARPRHFVTDSGLGFRFEPDHTD